MLVRAAIVMASIFMAGQALAGDAPKNFAPVENGVIMRPQPASAAQIIIAPPGFGQLVDGSFALHAQELKRIAVYTAIGNRDGAEILSGQLRQFGVTRDEVRSAIDRTHLHDGGVGTPLVRQSRIHSDDHPAMKVSY